MFHTDSFSLSAAPLLIAAPMIAGLLPAHIESLADHEIRDTYEQSSIYRNARLAEIPVVQRTRLVSAMQTLMDISVAFVLDEVNEGALRAAETLFHKAVGGIPIRPCTPQTYRAERDAELVDWWSQTVHRLAIVRNEINA